MQHLNHHHHQIASGGKTETMSVDLTAVTASSAAAPAAAAAAAPSASRQPRHFWFRCISTVAMSVITRFAAELVGTTMLLFFGCMGSLQWPGAVINSNFMASVTFGLVVMFIIQSFGSISGAHLNPAVTVSAYLQRQIGARMAVVYFVAQLVGSWIGLGLLKLATPAHVFRPDASLPGVCTTQPQRDLSVGQAFAIEYFATMVLITLICVAWDERNVGLQDSMPLKFGFALASLSIATGPATGCSLNPTRSLAPAIWNDDWQAHWIYWVAPISSAVVTTLLYQAVFADRPPKSRSVSDKAQEL